MLIKYFGSGASSSGAVEYVTGNKTARVLSGNPSITKDLIKGNKNKLKYRSGVINFGSDRPSQEQVQEIIEQFEASTFAGFEKDEYDILWVEHTDTENYHIHFVIPRLHLPTMKAFNPHYYKQDQKRLLKLQANINAQYGFINPFEPERRQTLELNTNWKNRNQAKERIDEIISQSIAQGLISNRDEVIELLRDNGLEVKPSKKYIAIKGENDKKAIRLKGVYYDESFTSRERAAAEVERTGTENRANAQGLTQQDRDELERLVSYKREINRKSYKQKHKNPYDYGIAPNRLKPLSDGLQQDIKQTNNVERLSTDMATTSHTNNRGENISNHTNREDTIEQQRRVQNNGDRLNDSIGTTATRGITESTIQESETHRRNRDDADKLLAYLERHTYELREKHQRDELLSERATREATESLRATIQRDDIRTRATQSECIARARETSDSKSALTQAVTSIRTTVSKLANHLMSKVQQTFSRGFGLSR